MLEASSRARGSHMACSLSEPFLARLLCCPTHLWLGAGAFDSIADTSRHVAAMYATRGSHSRSRNLPVKLAFLAPKLFASDVVPTVDVGCMPHLTCPRRSQVADTVRFHALPEPATAQPPHVQYLPLEMFSSQPALASTFISIGSPLMPFSNGSHSHPLLTPSFPLPH